MELTEHIRSKVQKALMITMPEEQLDEFIRQEIQRFFEKEGSEYRHLTPFGQMVRDEIEARAKESIKNWMDKNFERQWDGSQEKVVGEAVKRFIPVVIESLASNLASSALQRIREELGRY